MTCGGIDSCAKIKFFELLLVLAVVIGATRSYVKAYSVGTLATANTFYLVDTADSSKISATISPTTQVSVTMYPNKKLLFLPYS